MNTERIGADVDSKTRFAYFLMAPAVLWVHLVAKLCNRLYTISVGSHDSPTPLERLGAAESYIRQLEIMALALDRAVNNTPLPNENSESAWLILADVAAEIRAHSPVGQQEDALRRLMTGKES